MHELFEEKNWVWHCSAKLRNLSLAQLSEAKEPSVAIDKSFMETLEKSV